MLLSTDVQLFYFSAAICAGLIIGVLFDIYRVCRGFKAPKKILTAISDILFWILAAGVVFIFLLLTNKGDMRGYTVIGIFFGLILYLRYITKIFVDILRLILYYTAKIIRIIFLIIVFPFKIIAYGFRSWIINLKSKKKIKKNPSV